MACESKAFEGIEEYEERRYKAKKRTSPKGPAFLDLTQRQDLAVHFYITQCKDTSFQIPN
jgi:hypothetical protein